MTGQKNLEIALNGISSFGPIKRTSSIYESESWGIKNQPNFLNQVVEISTALEPEDLLQKALKLENSMGRERGEKWGSRIIDIDLLFYGNRVIDTETLKLPHPGIESRRFTLIPLAEMDPEWMHPISLKTMESLLSQCQDQGWVKKFL